MNDHDLLTYIINADFKSDNYPVNKSILCDIVKSTGKTLVT